MKSTTLHPDQLFLGNSDQAWNYYQHAMKQSEKALKAPFALQTKPFSGISVAELNNLINRWDICPEEGTPIEEVLEQVGSSIIQHTMVVHDPNCVAHLHCPPLIPALAAEALVSATNQSMDSWDQSPSATLLEERVIQWLAKLFYDTSDCNGVFTSGGTQSNFMGLLLARDHYLKAHHDWDVKKRGLPPFASQLRIICSEAAHFTVKQSASLLGLGEDAVITIQTDSKQQMCPHDLERKLETMLAAKHIPFALVATAGTTDFGSIDPLEAIYTHTKKHHMWLHVDAAYGGALQLSTSYRNRLSGIEYADSITVDFHKLFYQPISCGAFLLKEKKHFQLLKLHADYLNPEEDELDGIPNLVGKSIQTTRRFDALKLYVSLQVLGRKGFAHLIESTLHITQYTASTLAHHAHFEIKNRTPHMNAIVFRYLPKHGDINGINLAIRQHLLASGEIVLAKTKVKDEVYLKFTLLNPRITETDIDHMIHLIEQIGNQFDQ
ncbi:aspartate aminotransferase family protein [Hazenella sp. IB182357]|uniref:Aspartate aminotransferase family protein n=1 Tax=Polycladospora coralii TaxID=2771432 RepID=A0A926N6C1_9BACL|nr:aspartate aminotransferase family protein [Polycladospora coralii]MBD1371876.1 aspartate aminotransferase family protein [Polycladospora coralii]MBS7529337.1 aspartate aminotransferase family protein [Polycladospora coralii]